MHPVDTETPWKKEQANYDNLMRLAKGESAENVYSERELAEAFSDRVKIFIGCIDERVGAEKGWRKVAIAGSSVLLNEKQLEAFVDRLQLMGIHVDRVSFHEECGACGLFCESKGMETTNENKEEVGKIAAEKLLRALGMQGVPVRAGYKENGKGPDIPMQGNPDLHHARAIVVDGTGRFNAAALRLPAAFEIAARFAPNLEYIDDPDKKKGEFAVALGIAMGHHGLGQKKFDPAHGGQPLAVVIVEDPTDAEFSYKQLEARLKPAATQYGSAVTFVRLTPPVRLLKKRP